MSVSKRGGIRQENGCFERLDYRRPPNPANQNVAFLGVNRRRISQHGSTFTIDPTFSRFNLRSPPLKITLIQHTAVDSPGITTSVLERNQVASQVIRVDQGDRIPTRVDSDVLMTFGGPVALHLPDPPPWVDHERELIRQYVASGRRVFGICLGAQLIASALGAKTGPNAEPEFGWHPVHRTALSDQSKLANLLPRNSTVLHWHRNTFALPDGAVHLYQSDACCHQGFCIDDQIIGFQFHPEATAKTVDYYLKVANPSSIEGRYVQTPEQIQRGVAEYLEDQNEMLRRFLEGWLL